MQIRSIVAPEKCEKVLDECSVGSPSELRSQSWWTNVWSWCGRSVTSWHNLLAHRRFASSEKASIKIVSGKIYYERSSIAGTAYIPYGHIYVLKWFSVLEKLVWKLCVSGVIAVTKKITLCESANFLLRYLILAEVLPNVKAFIWGKVQKWEYIFWRIGY